MADDQDTLTVPAQREVAEEPADAGYGRPLALPIRIGLVKVLAAASMQLSNGHPIELAIIAFTQPPVIQHWERRARESHRGCLDSPGQVGAEDRGDLVAATPPSQATSLLQARLGQFARQPASRLPSLVVHGRAVSLKRQLDGHLPTLRTASQSH